MFWDSEGFLILNNWVKNPTLNCQFDMFILSWKLIIQNFQKPSSCEVLFYSENIFKKSKTIYSIIELFFQKTETKGFLFSNVWKN
jgi:hypothetical protein